MSEKQILNNILKIYLDDILRKTNDNETLELEASFGTRGVQKITKINYDNVIRTLKSTGFVLNKSNYLLRIMSEYYDKKNQKTYLMWL